MFCNCVLHYVTKTIFEWKECSHHIKLFRKKLPCLTPLFSVTKTLAADKGSQQTRVITACVFSHLKDRLDVKSACLSFWHVICHREAPLTPPTNTQPHRHARTHSHIAVTSCTSHHFSPIGCQEASSNRCFGCGCIQQVACCIHYTVI